MIQDDELSAGLDVAGIVFCQTLVETLVGLDQAQNLQVVLLLAKTQDQKESFQQQGIQALQESGAPPEEWLAGPANLPQS